MAWLRTMLVVMLAPVAAMAQQAPASGAKWEIEAHGGGAIVNTPSSGSSTATPAGTPFTTIGGRPSRGVSSWYFGDGAALLNQVNTILPARSTITPLDGVLGAPIVQRSGGGTFGVRATRHLTPRFSAEISVDYRLGRMELKDEVRTAVEASRSSFTSAFNGVLATGPFSNTNVTSTAEFSGRGGGQIVTTGALHINVKSFGRMGTYVTVGAGATRNLEGTPRAVLNGNYRFAILNVAPIDERDAVTLRADTARTLFTGVVGGGLRYALSPRWGLRVDVRDHMTEHRVATIVNAEPSVVQGSGPLFVISSFSSPSLQFSNVPTIRTSLSGGPVRDFKTFEGRGIEHSVGITTGVFWRF